MGNGDPILVRGKMARFTLVDRCGTPKPGPHSVIITEGLLTVALTATTQEGNPITLTGATNKQFVNDIPTPRFSYYTAVLSLIGVNPRLISMLSGQEAWDGVTPGTPTGFTVGDDVDMDIERFAMELWSGVDSDICDEDGDVGYGYFLLPKLAKGQVGDVTWQNDAINFTINGAVTKGGNDWGVGPFDDVAVDSGGLPSPLLRPLGDRKHFLADIVYAPPPAAVDDAVALGTPATGATAGIPGSYTPSGSYAPATLAAAATVTATPSTAWTAGQHVPLYDGSPIHWTGSAWAAGVA